MKTTTKHPARGAWARLLLLDAPLWAVVLGYGLVRVAHGVWEGPVAALTDAYRRTGETDDYGYYTDFYPDATYYGRQCTPRDVTTTDSNDLVLEAPVTPSAARHTMMTHGAVLLRNLLSNATAKELRDYLETRHDVYEHGGLPWTEEFFGDIGRLSLGLGVDDHPIIAKALEEVSHHEGLTRALEGIVGEDPAVVEISTLTTLHGAEHQGIHTDSDFFGSSLLYSRTFLHSYTLFMALQPTTSAMGATTVCPGTHWCANEDLSLVCHSEDNDYGGAPAFEVSSNGRTGRRVGLLSTGDGMMFNQNVWHRGPRNDDPDFPINRVMFILTFVSRKDLSSGDVRQQGLGTYYYQRWNMWGHTLRDLLAAGNRMTQPWAALKALGLWKAHDDDTEWGIPWPEHFCRQLANREDFFDDGELEAFDGYLRSFVPPEWLPLFEEELPDATGRKRRRRRIRANHRWEPYLKELVGLWRTLADRLYAGAVAAWTVLHLLGALGSRVLGASDHRRWGWFGWLRKLVVLHAVAALLCGSFWYHATERSYLAQRVEQLQQRSTPFAALDDTDPYGHLSATTLPTREDVLVGTRFDAPYLSSFDKVLDYHPGNARLDKAIASGGLSHPVLLGAFLDQPRDGIPSRVLLQDWRTGFWSLLGGAARWKALARAVAVAENPLLAALDDRLRVSLADARFGPSRETALSRKHAGDLLEDLRETLFAAAATTWTPPPSARKSPRWWFPGRPALRPTTTTSGSASVRSPNRLLLLDRDGALRLGPGDRVRAEYGDTGEYWEAEIELAYRLGDPANDDEEDEEDSEFVRVRYTLEGEQGDTGVLAQPEDRILPHYSFVQGDSAEVLYDEDGEAHPVEILRIHPLGFATLRHLEDGYVEERAPLDALRPPTTHTRRASLECRPLVLGEGDAVRANYRGEGRWFDATIDADHGNGSYAVAYDDGDYEEEVPVSLLRPR